MNRVTHRRLKAFVLPSGALLVAVIVLLQTGMLDLPSSAVDAYYYAVFVGGTLLAWRFRSGRVFCVLIALVLAHRSIAFFAANSTTAGRIAFQAVAALLPINFVLLSRVRERSLTLPSLTTPAAVLFVESVWMAVICRPGAVTSPWFLRTNLIPGVLSASASSRLPQPALFLYGIAFGVLLTLFIIHEKPIESGMFWAQAATFCALQSGAVGKFGGAYFATAGLILVTSIIENSYVLAYQDELTGLPARRAFHEAVSSLEAPYAVAVVDIDHFKKFNDTHGHDTGDQVLRMVSSRLADVTGGGEAYRVGGEEFSILFPDKAMRDAAVHLEELRIIVANSVFRVRGQFERRKETRGPDRRGGTRTRKTPDPRQRKLQFPDLERSVTISIGVAEPTATTKNAEDVINAADQALYRAKEAGRNRVETMTAIRKRMPRLKRSTA